MKAQKTPETSRWRGRLPGNFKTENQVFKSANRSYHGKISFPITKETFRIARVTEDKRVGGLLGEKQTEVLNA